MAQHDKVSLRHRLFEVLEEAAPGDRSSMWFDRFLITLITLNIAVVVLETVPSLHARFETQFLIFETISVLIFTVEYGLRIWVAPEHPALKRHGPVRGRIRYALSFGAIIDLLAFLPFYLAMFFGADLRVLRVLRLLRFLKLMRYSSALMTLQRVFYDERRALMASLLIMFGLLIISSTAIYHAERAAQPEAFGSIPAAMWWALATLTTVGYGDIVPMTLVGKMIGGVVMLFGLGMFALPLGIIAMGFSQEVNQRHFVVTRAMVARMPLFEDLDEREINRISRMMRARRYTVDETIIQTGDRHEELFFVAIGTVQAETEYGRIEVHDNDLFGEEAVLRTGAPIISAVAESNVHLMMLGANDARDLIRRHPELADALRQHHAELLAKARPEDDED
ncbi:MAG: cyclic nucleotide-gated ion channel [Minwuia sp.]|nr:cyclic nucleotide-gated ion channel [Minwuia sp.]